VYNAQTFYNRKKTELFGVVLTSTGAQFLFSASGCIWVRNVFWVRKYDLHVMEIILEYDMAINSEDLSVLNIAVALDPYIYGNSLHIGQCLVIRNSANT